MIRQKSFAQDGAALFLVPTPIGNLSEVSPRVKETLAQADVVACEDTRNTGKLLNLLELKKPLLSHHEHNQAASIPKIMNLLAEGKKIAVLSDAGYPLVSDPGAGLVHEALQQEYPVITMSGPNAAINALVASGLDCRHYLFYGFLDSKRSARLKQLQSLAEFPYTLVFYEAPHRIEDTLTDLLEVFGDRPMVLARELTKVHEEYLRGLTSEILAAAGDLKGEMVLVVSGYEPEEKEANLDEALAMVNELTAQGMKTKSAVKEVSARLDIPKNKLYAYVIENKSE